VAANLRSFLPADRPAVLELSRRALAREAEQVGNPIWETMDELESELGDWEHPPEETLLVAEEEGKVAGFGGIEKAPGWSHADLFGPLVAPAFRGQKLGRRLLEASVEKGRGAGADRVVASVGHRNVTGRMLLERTGFRPLEGAQALYRLTQGTHRPCVERPSGIRVRRGRPDDLEATLALYHECFPAGRFPEGVWRAGLERGSVYLAEEDGRPIAVVDVDPSDRWIYHLGVTHSERSHGVGAYLLSTVLQDYWRDHPQATLGLSVSADNVPAIRLYRRQGFAPWLVLQTFELALEAPAERE
jgi:ribosomal protein S18 acetylase RimI-like enzyme